MQEIWKDIKDYEGLYQVSNLGNVKASKREIYTGRGYYIREERPLKLRLNTKGYYYIDLSKNNKTKRFMVHRLVALMFISNPDNKPCVDHINTIRTDNRVENLRWVTKKENSNNPLSINNYSKANKAYGTNNRSARAVKCITTGEIFNTMTEAANKYNIKDCRYICACCIKRQKTTGQLPDGTKLEWEYIN